MSDRKMATIRKIAEINPIPDADAIEVAVVDGWRVVVKKGEFNIGDLVVFAEVDSWIPFELAPFLSKGKEPREYEGIKGERLRTVKLRGQISQGLLLPVNSQGDNPFIIHKDGNVQNVSEEQDVSDVLGIIKYEPPIPACLAGVCKSTFPSFIPKTDQERIQNLTKQFNSYKEKTWEITEKLDGSSCTMYYNNGEFGVCSRNLDLKEDYNNTFWRMAAQYDVENKLEHLGGNMAIQGEVVGEGIQGNPYKIQGQKFYVFDMYSIDEGTYCPSHIRQKICDSLGLLHVPVIGNDCPMGPDNTIEKTLEWAEGKSKLNELTEREGLVYKCNEDPSISFKAISNRFLLREK